MLLGCGGESASFEDRDGEGAGGGGWALQRERPGGGGDGGRGGAPRGQGARAPREHVGPKPWRPRGQGEQLQGSNLCAPERARPPVWSRVAPLGLPPPWGAGAPQALSSRGLSERPAPQRLLPDTSCGTPRNAPLHTAGNPGGTEARALEFAVMRERMAWDGGPNPTGCQVTGEGGDGEGSSRGAQVSSPSPVKNITREGVGKLWPTYTGGRSSALRKDQYPPPGVMLSEASQSERDTH